MENGKLHFFIDTSIFSTIFFHISSTSSLLLSLNDLRCSTDRRIGPFHSPNIHPHREKQIQSYIRINPIYKFPLFFPSHARSCDSLAGTRWIRTGSSSMTFPTTIIPTSLRVPPYGTRVAHGFSTSTCINHEAAISRRTGRPPTIYQSIEG